MGGVASIYIQYQDAGDQYVGRTVCGLNPHDPSFAVLPPRFKPSYDPNPLLRTLFTNFDSSPEGVRNVLTMTTASVLYSYDKLLELLPRDHCLFSTALFMKDFGCPISDIVECCAWKPGDVVKPTGIPPHVSVMLHTMQMRDFVSETMKTILDSCGAVGLSREEIRDIVTQTCERVVERLAPEHSVQQHQEARRSSLPQLYLTSKNRMSRLPPDFKLPVGSLQTAWIAYLFPNKRLISLHFVVCLALKWTESCRQDSQGTGS